MNACHAPVNAAHHARERGAVGGVEAIPFGLLLFVAGILVVANTWAVIDAKVATEAAAEQSARYLVESDGDVAGALERGEAAFEGIVGHRRRLDGTVRVDGAFRRCARVTVTFRYVAPMATVPLVGGWGRGIAVESSHSEIVDPYRAGLGAASAC